MTLPSWLASVVDGGDSGGLPDRSHLSLVAHDEVPAPDDPDRALVERVRAGDEGAFREVWDAYHERLADFAYRYVRSMDAAADVVQHVFFVLWRDRERVRPRGTLAGYLFAATRHRAWNVVKHERVARAYESEALASADPSGVRNVAEAELETSELVAEAVRILATVPPRAREIFLMHREDGLAPREIAGVLGLSPQTVYNQLARVVKALTEGLARWRAEGE